MRDVTDNVTGELPGLQQKRGRGRPPKAHALTNAERQAAFRARRKAQQPVEAKSVTKRMTVTEMLSDVDAYDDCRLEVERLRDLLVESRAETKRVSETLQSVLHQNSWVAAGERADQEDLDDVRRELEAKQEQVGMLIDRQRELDAELVRVRYELSVQLDKNVDAEREIERLCKELAAAKKGAGKSVTPSNEKSGEHALLQLVLELLALACKGKRDAGVNVLLRSRAAVDVTGLGIRAWPCVSEAIQGRYVPYVTKNSV